jgi:hypothetical protein
MASNLLLGTMNRIDSATLAAGSWQSTLPLNNIKDRRLSKLARTTDATANNTKFTIDFGQPRSVGVIALIAHNFSVNATVRIYGDDASDFATPVYDSASIQVWPSGVIPQDLLEWEDDNFWLGTVSQEAVAGFNAPFVHIPSSAQTLRYWKVEITDTTNSDGYIHLGRVFIGSAWQPQHNRSYGAAIAYEDTSVIEASLSGEEFFDVRRRRRTHSFELGFLSQVEAYDRVLDLQRNQGVVGEVLIIPDITDTANQAKVSFLGRLKNLSAVQINNPELFTCNLEIQEVI